ncbi:TPA: 2,3-diphosphoglycerate-dependent phosphoglycerate mutase [Candidatus Woesearchaeota archaeon]|nr:2,3-diphosphoglycerate-dependent phosphoglycerate mutase [Candidatus Woesearchaeota archaeon]
MIKLVLLRHGQSTWNRENRFTGWTDVPLSEQGKEEARQAGRILKQEGYAFDIAFTSVLKRAIDTLSLAMEEMRHPRIPITYAWQLNERHYGALQGLNKAEMAAKYGEQQVKLWRRSYAVQPPALEKSDKRHPSHDPLYKDLDEKDLPSTESLKDVVAKVVPYWQQEIAPLLKQGKRILISAHGNSLRALVKHFDGIPEEEITELNIPTGMPLVYELDDHLKPVRHYYLGDPEAVKKAMEAIAQQGRAKK